jgi:mannose-6-phosphate isomerase-like protein (cupin superfamily)
MENNKGRFMKEDIFEICKNNEVDLKKSVVGRINDHVIKLCIINNQEFNWHYHKNSDELFYIISGKLKVHFDNHVEDVLPGQLITVPKNVRHKTESLELTKLLCYELMDIDYNE